METLLKALSVGGGRSGGSSFFLNGDSGIVSSPGAMIAAATSETILYVVPALSSWNYQGLATVGSQLGTDNIIQYLTQVTITPTAGFAAVAGFSVNTRLYRAGALVTTGSALISGWTNTPTLVAFTPLILPWNAANTSVIAPYGQAVGSTSVGITNVGLYGLQPGDVVTLFQNNGSGGAVTPPALYVTTEVS